ncbi:MAG TPA: methyl-accepting chemotaxis protein [Prolixibacteraceae bacterium]|nr:methyl-accepting chemotaxis protein [Prolixibacteraceae bacterium]
MRRNRLTLKLKLNIYILTAATIVFGVTICYISFRLNQITYNNAIEIVKGSAREYQSKISADLNTMMESARTISNSFNVYPTLKPEVRDEVYDNILRQNLIKNQEYLSVGVYWELKALDKNYKKRNGRYYNGFFRQGNKIINQKAIEDTTNQELKTTYYQVRKKNRDVIVNPYYDQSTKEVKNILMTSLLAPIKGNSGEFEGMVGIDISLEQMNKIIERVKPFENAVSYMISEDNRIVAHTKSELTGKNFLNSLAADSTIFQKYFAKSSNVDHSFTYKNSLDGIEYFVAFQPILINNAETNWFIGIEVPTSVILSEARTAMFRLVIAAIIGLIVLCIVIIAIADKITSPIIKAVEFAKTIASGNLNAKLQIEQNDEIGDLAESLSIMASRLTKIIGEIMQSSDTIASNTSNLLHSSSALAEGASRQAASSEEMSTSMELVVNRIQKNTENAQETERIALMASKGIQLGKQSTQALIDSMNNIIEKISIINEIARQTNLLAINAAIEASRYGLQGKGFGVVAAEIKKLAERAHLAANEINELSRLGILQANDTSDTLLQIVPEIEQTAELVKQISSGSKEQRVNSFEINAGIQQLNKVIQQNASASYQLSSNSRNIAQQSENLKKLIAYFKVDGLN